jgi:hypothetical protein
MGTKDNRKSALTKYQARVLREYEHILEAIGLNPDRVFDLAEGDTEAVVPVLKSMTDQAVRSDVIFEYTFIDMELDSVLIRHFFGTGKKLQAAKKTKRYKTLNLMLQNTYLMQKLTIVRSFKDVPKSIVSKVAAINDLRNGLAHTFFVRELKPAKRTYKGHNIFTRKGLEAFREDVQEIRYFFMPWLKSILEDDENQEP